MKLRIIKLLILLIFAGNLYSCKKKDEFPKATGTIIGGYNCVYAVILVQVDEEYPIGETFNHNREGYPIHIYNGNGTYHNVIQVPQNMPFWSENKPIANQRISFSYREFDINNKDDESIFLGAACLAIYGTPNLPKFIITRCKLLE